MLIAFLTPLVDKEPKFIEIKGYIGLYEYTGEERKELSNTKEIIKYILINFPN